MRDKVVRMTRVGKTYGKPTEGRRQHRRAERAPGADELQGINEIISGALWLTVPQASAENWAAFGKSLQDGQHYGHQIHQARQ